MSTLLKLIANSRPLIAAWGLREVSTDDTGFRDNGTAIYANDKVLIRLESEQGAPGIDVASQQAPTDWIDASLLFNMMRGKSLVEYNEFADVVGFLVTDAIGVTKALTQGFATLQRDVDQAKRARHRMRFPGVDIG